MHVKESLCYRADKDRAIFEKAENEMKTTVKALLLTSALVVVSGPVFAQSKGDWTVAVGIGNVNPKSNNGDLAGLDSDVDDSTRPIFTAEYFFADNFGVELLVSTPFDHDISLDGLGNVGSTQHLPPTISLNYHFPTQSQWKPYLGMGLNYTNFFEEESSLGKLELESSFGYAFQAGVDYMLNDKSALRFTARYIDIDSDVYLNEAKIGTTNIDPVVLSASYVFQF